MKLDIRKLTSLALAETVFLLALVFGYDSFIVANINDLLSGAGQGFQLQSLGLALSFETAIALFIVFVLKGLLVSFFPQLKKYI